MFNFLRHAIFWVATYVSVVLGGNAKVVVDSFVTPDVSPAANVLIGASSSPTAKQAATPVKVSASHSPVEVLRATSIPQPASTPAAAQEAPVPHPQVEAFLRNPTKESWRILCNSQDRTPTKLYRKVVINEPGVPIQKVYFTVADLVRWPCTGSYGFKDPVLLDTTSDYHFFSDLPDFVEAVGGQQLVLVGLNERTTCLHCSFGIVFPEEIARLVHSEEQEYTPSTKTHAIFPASTQFFHQSNSRTKLQDFWRNITSQ